MKEIKRRVKNNIILIDISSSAWLPVAYYGKRGQSTNQRPPLALLQVGWMTELLDAEIILTVERWTCALDYVSAVLNDWFLLFRDGPPLESLSSESLCAIFTTPNQE
ncbi:hypothetical protein AYI68_g4806 [Smittium mucronatum]|uniref:Uncharacterized protein n=1 Tax=Smittium mucronatum TaxID=133383 RepID=A0A1R0GW28_9FUNG|nr:hypothetical protein AYI68_g4806 [Smittium mucronatum]